MHEIKSGSTKVTYNDTYKACYRDCYHEANLKFIANYFIYHYIIIIFITCYKYLLYYLFYLSLFIYHYIIIIFITYYKYLLY